MNETQQKAIETIQGYILVLAGAGTGKTRVLTERISYLIEKNLAAPHEIMAVTFTNKAAEEIRRRIEQKVGGSIAYMWLGTFHSIAMRILRQYAEYIGLGSRFTLIDRDDQIRLVKQILKESNQTKEDPKRILYKIDEWKNKGQFPQHVTANTPQEQQMFLFYKEYQERLFSLNACDFGDLLLYNIDLFEKFDDILTLIKKQIRYVLVDEYQDTNTAQYTWLRYISSGHHNLCCVGDDDQSIYGWRGAEIKNILDFEKDFENATLIRLEQNYRSSGHILAAANALIDHNQKRLGKKLWTSDEMGEKIVIKGVLDSGQESRFVISKIQELKEKYSLKDISILVRASFQTRQFEEELLRFSIPYRIIGGFRFYERQEIRDAIAYARFLISPEDSLALERIINLPKRGIGPTTVQKMYQIAREKKISLYKAALEFKETAPKKTKEALEYFFNKIQKWRDLEPQFAPFEWILAVLRDFGYWDLWKNDDSGETRIENLQELIHAIKPFESIDQFLEHISLVFDKMDLGEADVLTLMTLHSAKGLEFPIVFLPGWEDGLFPHQKSLRDKNLEEERRLGYVGISRAKKYVFISYAVKRFHIPGGWKSSFPSRFINELSPQNCIHLRPQYTTNSFNFL